ncbi:uncharacterized protein LOC8040439 [Ixodes scapularis]|uniref:Secreted protein, putative n=1 Tax=Ixodes scapularis TaxID=6945 RepID=B7QFE2_IXOSC|nr:uncharacterized protein LOC8040439 [Ixodes scapularis]EEC17564.1 secreted protein, putative [Ixodes scapularis]|eukprot:XP_002414256.1 secreted protein, putative [Ixodes scapularis]
MTALLAHPICLLVVVVAASTVTVNAQSDDNKILVSAAWLCEGLECPEGKECTLEQPQCTSEDCSLKPSCSPRLENCKPCNEGCAHAILNREASTGCHPCLCEIAVVRKPERVREEEPNGNGSE